MENLVGRLTADAKVNKVGDERTVVNFTIAINESYRPKGGGDVKKQTKYVDCSYWINVGIAEYLKKGSIVELSGIVSARAWKNMDGEPVAGLNFHVNSIKLHGGSKKDESTVEKPANKISKDDLPF
jgi:single-strand DNA-binding protein